MKYTKRREHKDDSETRCLAAQNPCFREGLLEELHCFGQHGTHEIA